MECITFMYLETEACMLKNACQKEEKYSGFTALLLMAVKQPKLILPPKLFSVTNLSPVKSFIWQNFLVKFYFLESADHM